MAPTAGAWRFDEESRRAQRLLRENVASFVWRSRTITLLTFPVAYSLLAPIALFDVWTTVYQWICFPIYGIARVPRRAYFVMDRHLLAYLNGIEKLHCLYCSYANGLIAYVREVAARTEQYWCPIKHDRPVHDAHARYPAFVDYGDGAGYRQRLPVLRNGLRPRI